MTPFASDSYNDLFSHLYVEHAVMQHPETERIMQRFARSGIIPIEHYKDVFNRTNQHFDAQSQSKNLILAHRNAPFMYQGSYYSDAFEFEQFFYAPTMLGCLYDCQYCYLQGLYNSANTVLFVNLEDYFAALVPLLKRPTLLAISYDTDTLAVERLVRHSQRWIEFARHEPMLHLEIRTKSANFNALRALKPHDRIVLAWTLSPQMIIDAHEHATPSLHKRLQAVSEAIASGWRVRLCIDPMIYTSDFDTLYPPMIDQIFTAIEPSSIDTLTLGSFRMSSVHLGRIKKLQRSALAFYPYHVRSQIATYPENIESQMLDTMQHKALLYLPPDKIRCWKSDEESPTN